MCFFLVEPTGRQEKTVENCFFEAETAQSKELAEPSRRRRKATTMRRWWGTFNSRATPLSLVFEGGGWLFHLRKIENIEKVCHSKNYDRPQMVEPTGISAPYKVSAGNGAECFAPEFARIFCEDKERLQIW